MVATAAQDGTSPAETEEQTDFEKLRRIPFLYGFGIFNTAGLLCTAGAPLTLFAAELGVSKGGIGLIGGIMPFAQVLCIGFLPLVMRFGQRHITALGYGIRYLFLLPFLLAPTAGSPAAVFWILFGCMIAFSAWRAFAETALWPWSQEYTPRFLRGKVSGTSAMLTLPVALVGSYLVNLWLDSHTGITRFFPVFVVGIVLGLFGSSLLLGLRGGKPRPGAARGFESIRAIVAPTKDKNFLIYLYSSGTQQFAYTVTNLFLLLFFKERLGLSAGTLVLMTALTPIGGATGAVIGGFFVDRYGTRPIRIVLQAAQVAMLCLLFFVHDGLPMIEVIVGLSFFMIGMIFQSATSIGPIYMLNYVPPERKESYMALRYASDGLIGGGATFLAGAMLQFLLAHPPSIFGFTIGGYEVLFLVTALVVVTSAIAFAMLREEGGTGVRDFLGQFREGNPVLALWNIRRSGHLTSEERRRELTYGFGNTHSALVKEELFEALGDPSFDVRHEAIHSLGHLPKHPAVVRALESVLAEDDLAELQIAALIALGRLRATSSGAAIARFLDDENPVLRARAIRALGEIRDESALPRIRMALHDDPVLDCRMAAVSALGKLRDRESVAGLVAIYRSFADDTRPHGRVVLLALAKIFDVEAAFSHDWRREERLVGSRLPEMLRRIAAKAPAEKNTALTRGALDLTRGHTAAAFAALQGLRPEIAASRAENAHLAVELLDGTRDMDEPPRILLILLCLVIRPTLG